MQTLPISKVKDKLNELVDEAANTHEHVTITRNGSPAAVLVSADEWESLQETLFWLSQPGIREDLASADSEHEAGATLSEADVRSRLNLPRRT
jgi:antitoxin YefM